MTGKRVRESELWTKVRRTFPGLIKRVENTVGNGTPDCYHVNGWIELKVLDRMHPVREGTAMKWGLRGDQAAWHHEWFKAGGLSHILAGHNVPHYGWCYYLLEGQHALDAFHQHVVPFKAMHHVIDWSSVVGNLDASVLHAANAGLYSRAAA